MKHNGRGIDRNWDVRKYKGDGAYYAYCRCKFFYSCGDIINKKEPDTWLSYHYCPSCGAHKKWYNTTPRKIDKYFPWE